MDKETMKAIETDIDRFNTEIVNIHCELTSNNLDLTELRKIQKHLNILSTEFYQFFDKLENEIHKAINVINNNRKKADAHEKYELIFSLIPLFGVFIALRVALKNYNLLVEAKIMEENLNKTFDELSIKLNIINRNIQRKYFLLNKKLLNYATNCSETIDENNFEYYDANEIIINYLDNNVFNSEEVEPAIKQAMINLLQKDLKTNCDDLNELLSEMKKKNNPKKLHLIKK